MRLDHSKTTVTKHAQITQSADGHAGLHAPGLEIGHRWKSKTMGNARYYALPLRHAIL